MNDKTTTISETKTSALDAMLAQYEANNKPKYEKRETANVYDLKNYFNTFIEKDVKTATKSIRILPTPDGTSPFIEMHAHSIKIDGSTKKFACLQEEKSEACPFCEARAALLATGKDSDKELAKKYSERLYYIVKVIDRDNESDGVKFWRFAHDYSHKGIFDKIQGVMSGLKKDRDITDKDNGRDLSIIISRDQNNYPIVSSIVHQDAGPISEDAEQTKTWLADTRTWENVYSVKSYDYLEILVKGGTPVWDKESKTFIDKAAAKPESDKLEAELTMGIENVKAGITTATATATATKTVTPEVDELPF